MKLKARQSQFFFCVKKLVNQHCVIVTVYGVTSNAGKYNLHKHRRHEKWMTSDRTDVDFKWEFSTQSYLTTKSMAKLKFFAHQSLFHKLCKNSKFSSWSSLKNLFCALSKYISTIIQQYIQCCIFYSCYWSFAARLLN